MNPEKKCNLVKRVLWPPPQIWRNAYSIRHYNRDYNRLPIPLAFTIFLAFVISYRHASEDDKGKDNLALEFD